MSTPPAADATRNLLAQLWQRNLPILEQRLAIIEAAATAAQTNTLTADLRHQAVTEVHKLSGSLGMFGYPEATDIAREIEAALEAGTEAGIEPSQQSPAPPNPTHLAQLAANLRSTLFPTS